MSLLATGPLTRHVHEGVGPSCCPVVLDETARWLTRVGGTCACLVSKATSAMGAFVYNGP